MRNGIYLRCAAEASKSLGAVGIDLDPNVVELARTNLATWRLASRVEVRQADLRCLPSEMEGPWDMILLPEHLLLRAQRAT
jgi:23S rRNA G2445 N2-methylase RlmL